MDDFSTAQVTTTTTETKNSSGILGTLKAVSWKQWLLILAILFLAGIVYLVFFLRDRNRPEFVTVGLTATDYAALIWLAEENEYFFQQDLPVDLKIYRDDVQVLEKLNEGNIDVAVTFPYYLTDPLLQSDQHSVFASIGKFDNHMIIADIAKSIYDYDDLKEKRVGYVSGTPIEFWLETGLSTSRLRSKDMQLIDTSSRKLPEDLADAKLDAVAAAQPLAYEVLNFVNTQYSALSWSLHKDYQDSLLLVANKEYINNNEAKLKDFLAALYKAEAFLNQNPSESKQIVAAKAGLEQKVLEEIWPNYRLELYLDSEITELLEIQKEWRIENKEYSADAEVSFLNVINPGLLREIKPQAIIFND